MTVAVAGAKPEEVDQQITYMDPYYIYIVSATHIWRLTYRTCEWDPKLVPLHAALPAQLPATLSALRDPDASAAIELAFSTLGPERWTASAALGVLVGGSLARTPVGDLLKSRGTTSA